jgi:fumarate reductase subunit C
MSRRPYTRPVSRSGWWLANGLYFRYMLRELSCLFIGAYTLVLIVGIYRLSQGPGAFEAFMAAFLGPAGFALAAITFVFAAYHTYTWFQVTPKAMPLVVAGKRVPGFVIIAAHWLGFVIVSAAIWFLAVST